MLFGVDRSKMSLRRKKRISESLETSQIKEDTDNLFAVVKNGDLSELDHLTVVQRVGLKDDSLSGFYNNETGEFFPGFHLDASDLLVDVGCGNGGPLGFCVLHAGQVLALDIDSDALNNCRSNPELANVTFLEGSSEAIPLDDQVATKVMCLEVLEHVDDPGQALAELYRIGQPGSYYLISVPHQRSETILQRVAPPAAFEKPHHIRIFGTDDFKQLVSSSGLEIISHDLIGAFSTITVALYWLTAGRLSASGQNQIETQFVFDNPSIEDWAKAWSYLLDLPNGEDLKGLLDSLFAKSQIILAKKPLRAKESIPG